MSIGNKAISTVVPANPPATSEMKNGVCRSGVLVVVVDGCDWDVIFVLLLGSVILNQLPVSEVWICGCG